jgi:hypothetical protein
VCNSITPSLCPVAADHTMMAAYLNAGSNNSNSRLWKYPFASHQVPHHNKSAPRPPNDHLRREINSLNQLNNHKYQPEQRECQREHEQQRQRVLAYSRHNSHAIAE